MPSSSRSAPIVALFALGLMSIVPSARAYAGNVPSRQPASSAGSCCSPSQVAATEARLPVPPLNPKAAVQTVTQLKLVNVQVLASGGNPSVHRPNGNNTIQYVFGFTPPSTGKLFVRPRPRFVVVTEMVEQRAPSGISITPVLSGVQNPPIPQGYSSPLVLVAPVPQRRLTLFVESNIPRNRLQFLGEFLLESGRGGK